jgi:outer membrane lipoprotein-sorting protein
VSILGIGAAAAQPGPPTAATVLGNVQQRYANASHLTAQFRQVVTYATFNTTKTSDGKLCVAKPVQFRFDYLKKQQSAVTVARTFAFDGSTLWLIDHENKQILQNQVQGSALPAAVSFLTGASNLTTQFNVALNTSGTFGGKSATVLELTPKQPSAQYKQVFFVVDPSDWHVSESIVIDANGDVNDFKFFNSDLTSTVKPQWFQVNPSSLPTYKLIVVGNGSTSAGAPSTAAKPAAPSAPAGAGSSAAPMPTP